MIAGLLLFLPSLALAALAQTEKSFPILVAAAALTGGASALGYRGSLEIVQQLAPKGRRAELMSSYLLACYASNSLPIVGLGIAMIWWSETSVGIGFAAAIALIVIAAQIGAASRPNNRVPK